MYKIRWLTIDDLRYSVWITEQNALLRSHSSSLLQVNNSTKVIYILAKSRGGASIVKMGLLAMVAKVASY